jgi:hypothetical protein
LRKIGLSNRRPRVHGPENTERENQVLPTGETRSAKNGLRLVREEVCGVGHRSLNQAQKNHQGKARTGVQSHEEQPTSDPVQAQSEKHTAQTNAKRDFFH